MTEYKFALGDVVCIDPAETGRGAKGKVVGCVTHIDGSVGYLVSTTELTTNGPVRVVVAECELTPLRG